MDERVVRTERFQVLRRLGAGATGVVYEAENRNSGERVALKALSRVDAMSLYRFKREFRALADVSHPNLVALNELFHERGQWFLSMELVHGRSFVEYVRHDRVRADCERLRAALPQLVRALHALHEAGRLHRDIKPSNILVTDAGRVVVLDFGFVRELDPEQSGETQEILGTPAYMAPEQGEQGGAVAASDWYAVGVVLFEALTGRLPTLSTKTSATRESGEFVRRPSSLDPAVPPDLDALCGELLSPDPNDRPSGRALLARVGAAESEPPRERAASFVGRRALRIALHGALARALTRGEPQLVSLIGASAMGKTALLERFAVEASERGVWALFSRCHERESVPFKALDGIIDSLVRRLRELNDAEVERLLPEKVGLLAQPFPALLRVPGVARHPSLHGGPEPQSQPPRAAMAALKELFARVVAHHPVVLLIDDLHWSDVESVRLLEALWSGSSARGVLLLVAYDRDARTPCPALLALDDLARRLKREQVQELSIEPLDAEESTEFAQRILGASGAQWVTQVVAQASGVPLFIQELSRESARARRVVTLRELLEGRLRRLSPPARSLFELVAVAAAPVPIAVARELAQDAYDSSVRELVAGGLVRLSAHPHDTVDARHDHMRAFVQRALSPSRAARHHLALARGLSAHGAKPELLAHHFSRAGDREQAANYAARAAEAAARVGAFTSAARCYDLALAWGSFPESQRGALLVCMAESLALAGRACDAAEAYLRAADLLPEIDAGALRARAVEQFMRAGQLERGLALAERLLRTFGLRSSQAGLSTHVGLLARRTVLRVRGYDYTPREGAAIDPRALARVEAARSLAAALGPLEPSAAANMQALHMLLALRCGDTNSVARALGYEAVYFAIEGEPRSDQALATLERQRALLGERPTPYFRAFSHYAHGLVEWGRGKWAPALAQLDAAEATFEKAGLQREWEYSASQFAAFSCLGYLGRYSELRTRIARSREQLQSGDDGMTRNWVLLLSAFSELMAHDVAGARRWLASARTHLPEARFTLPHAFALIVGSYVHLYGGEGHAALARFTREWPTIERSLILRLQTWRIELRRSRAMAALGAAASAHEGARELHMRAERELMELEREGAAWSRAVALPLRAELARQRCEHEVALTTFRAAERELRAVGMAAHAEAARRNAGLLLGAREGAELVHSAERALRAMGATDPARACALTTGVVLSSSR